MSGYTPTTEEVREAVAEWAWSRRMFRPELAQSDGGEFDRWLDAHDTEVRAEAESAPAKDERLVRYMAMATPLGYQSALTVVQEMTKLIDAETRARGVVAEEPEIDDEPCKAEIWSGDIFRHQKVDPYWMRCHRVGAHDKHENSETGATWPVKQEGEKR